MPREITTDIESSEERDRQAVLEIYRQFSGSIATVFEIITRGDDTSHIPPLSIDQKMRDMKQLLQGSMNQVKDVFGQILQVVSPDALDAGSYSNHDINAPLRRALQWHKFLDVYDRESSENEQTTEFWRRLELLGYDLEKVLFIFQDLCARRISKDVVPKEFVDMDKRRGIGDVLSTVEKLIHENSLKVTQVVVSIPPEVRNVKINCAHGVLFNKISNMLSNVMSGRTDIQAQHIWFEVQRGSDNFFEFKVSDDGIGIPPENLTDPISDAPQPTNIFQEGFTTKSGKGLGLACAKKQIESMGGEIIVTSTRVNDQKDIVEGKEYAGNGRIHTTFTIRFPILEQAA